MLTIFAWTLIFIAGVPTLVWALQTLAAAMLPVVRRPERDDRVLHTSLVALVPAHDEAAGIGATLEGLRKQLRRGDRIIVVADNCTDATAAVASAAGAEVIERHNSLQRGKSHALAYGIDALRADPPDILLIIDADCCVAEGFMDVLRAEVRRTAAPVQALYLMQGASRDGRAARLGEFAWRVRNQLRPGGMAKLRLPCQLMGTGMALPWHAVESIQWGSGALAEDLQASVDLALQGAFTSLCEQALVTSAFPTTAAAAAVQKRRWEHGHLHAALTQAPRLLGAGLARRSIRLIALGLDLLVPPVALLAMLIACAVVASLADWSVSGSRATALTSAALAMVAVAGFLAAWLRVGRSLVSLPELAFILAYVARKIPMYLAFLWRRQKEWVRTDRT